MAELALSTRMKSPVRAALRRRPGPAPDDPFSAERLAKRFGFKSHWLNSGPKSPRTEITIEVWKRIYQNSERGVRSVERETASVSRVGRMQNAASGMGSGRFALGISATDFENCLRKNLRG